MGVNPRKFPRDFATFVRFTQALRRVRPVYPMPPSLTSAQLHEFLAESGNRYEVEWLTVGGGQ